LHYLCSLPPVASIAAARPRRRPRLSELARAGGLASYRATLGFKQVQASCGAGAARAPHSSGTARLLEPLILAARGAGVDDPHTHRKKGLEEAVWPSVVSSRSASWPTPEATHATRTRAGLCSRFVLQVWTARQPSQPSLSLSISYLILSYLFISFSGGIGFFNKEDSTRKGGTVQVRTSERIIRAE
jgi:hypothetical protein